MFKGYSSKSKANRGLAAYGELAVLAAEKLVHMATVEGEDVMKWGFLTEHAEAARDGKDFGTFQAATAAAKEGKPDDAAIQASSMEIAPNGGDSMEGDFQTGDEKFGAAVNAAREENTGVAVGNPFGALIQSHSAPMSAHTPTPRKPREGGNYTIEKDRPRQNDVTRPSVGGVCREIWDHLTAKYDIELAKPDGAPKVPTLPETKAALGHLDMTTVSVQYYRWRKFNGISGRQA